MDTRNRDDENLGVGSVDRGRPADTAHAEPSADSDEPRRSNQPEEGAVQPQEQGEKPGTKGTKPGTSIATRNQVGQGDKSCGRLLSRRH